MTRGLRLFPGALRVVMPLVMMGAAGPWSSLRAQAGTGSARPGERIQLTLAGGVARNTSNVLARGYFGYALQAGVGVRTPVPHLLLRGDVLFSDAGSTILRAASAGITLDGPAIRGVRPYLLGTVGGYAEQSSPTLGTSLGVGFAAALLSRGAIFLEARVYMYRDPLAGQPYVVPQGVISGVRDRATYLWQPFVVGLRF